jgi:hypothetical protein
MILNTDHRGQTAGGRYTYRPYIEMEPDDYPPNSQFWSLAFDQHKADLISLIGSQYTELAEMIWPKDTIEEYTWKELTKQLGGALNAYKLGERNLCKLCVAAWDALVAQPEYLKD